MKILFIILLAILAWSTTIPCIAQTLDWGVEERTLLIDSDGDGNPDTTLQGVLHALLYSYRQPVLNAQGAAHTATTNSSGFYLFPDLAAGSYQVARSQPAGYGSLSDKDDGNPDLIGYKQTIPVSNSSINTGNELLEFLQSCPDQWTAWQDKWDDALGGLTGPTDNPDGDRYSNLLEYAFCMPPHSGIRKPFCLTSSVTVEGGVDGVYSRTAGGAKDVIYQLELAQTLGSPTVWTSLLLDNSNTTVTSNGDGTETVRISNLESFFPPGTSRGFVRIRIILDDGTTQATDHTETLGWTKFLMDACCSTYNNPFLQCALFTGTVDSVDGQDLVVANSVGPFSLASAITDTTGLYIEVTRGENTGRRYDVTALGSDRITVANDNSLYAASPPFNTHEAAPAADLAGDSFILRRHHTLNYLFAPNALGATNSQSTADQVQIFAGGAWTIYWIYDENDSDPATARWVSAADAGNTNMGGNVIPPGQGMFFKNRHDPVTLLAFGEVRENPFIRPMRAGNNLVGGGYPIDQSLNGTGGRAMNPSTGFFGSTDFKTADTAFIWQADADSAALGYHTYYLANGAPTFPTLLRWVIVGDKNLVARDSEILLPGNRSAFIRAKDPIPEYTCPAPWSP
jgi:large repetitive protein